MTVPLQVEVEGGADEEAEPLEDLDDEIVMESAPGRVTIRDAERGFRLGPMRLGMSGGADLEIEVVHRSLRSEGLGQA